MYDRERLLHRLLPDALWDHMRTFLTNLAGLPFWFDKNMSTTVFGPKQNLDFWEEVFQTGMSPLGIRILAQPLDLNQMIQPRGAVSQRNPWVGEVDQASAVSMSPANGHTLPGHASRRSIPSG